MSIPINKSNAFTSISILSGSNLTLQSGSIIPFALPASYVIFSGSVPGVTGPYYSINGTTNNIDYYGTNAATVIQNTWTNAASNSKVFHKATIYNIASRLTLDRSDIFLDAEPGTTFMATTDIGSGSPNGWYGMVVFGDKTNAANQRSNIRIRNITFDANSQTRTPAFTLVGCKNVLFEGCIFKGSGGTAVGGAMIIGGNDSSIGLTAATTKFIKFVDCEFSSFSTHGLYFDGGTGAPTSPVIDGVWLERCYIHDCNGAGVANAMRAGRVIARVRIKNCYFELNAKSTGGPQQAHVDDVARVGWVDFLAEGNYFGPAGSNKCGGISDHNGFGIRWTDNFFDLGTTGLWWGAIGDARAGTNRSEQVRIHGNIIRSGSSMDFDSSKYVRICHNVFYQIGVQAISAFGEHIQTMIYDNDFIENGQAPTQEYHKAGISCARGMDIRRNVFRDNQGTQTQLYGVHEIAGDIGTEVNIYEGNDFTNTPGGIDGGPLVIQNYSYIIRNNRNGFNPRGYITPDVTWTGSPFTYKNNDFVSEDVFIFSGSITNITGSGGFSLSTGSLHLEPLQTIIITTGSSAILPVIKRIGY